jgi:DNA modification methylase
MSVQILIGDCRKRLASVPDNSVHLCISSPPYFGLRDYGTGAWAGGNPDCDHVVSEIRTGQGLAAFSANIAGGGHKQGQVDKIKARSLCPMCGARRIDRQMGLEETPLQYVAGMVELFREVRRVLRPDGVLFLNLGDSYAGMGGQTPQTGELMKGRARQRQNITRSARIRADGLKNKDLIGIPWRVAFALQADGWWLRQDIIWAKPNPMPESVGDRCTKAHEYLFLLSKAENYFWDGDAIAEPAIYAPGCGWEEEAKGERGGRRQRPQATKLDPEQSFRAIRPTRNKRSVWTVATQGFAGEYCTGCKTFFEGDALSSLRVEKINTDGQDRKRRWCSCGRHDAWLSHFATFPPDLIEPCVLAGSPRLACVDCGAPFVRQYEKVLVATAKAPQQHLQHERDADPNDQGSNRQREGHKKGFAHARQPGEYLPSCKCEAPGRPAMVLDPFGGAGTTGLVADRAGRDAILCELNPDFGDMARQRIAGDGGMFCRVEVLAEAAE